MEIGKPQRIHKVEPVRDPVPREPQPVPLGPERREPATAPGSAA
jgi:hypothetical protein